VAAKRFQPLRPGHESVIARSVQQSGNPATSPLIAPLAIEKVTKTDREISAADGTTYRHTSARSSLTFGSSIGEIVSFLSGVSTR
jgi:hypothetical protein